MFFNAMSSYVHVEHQLGLSIAETIRSKQIFERRALEHGVVVENYLVDNGVFKASVFFQHLREHN